MKLQTIQLPEAIQAKCATIGTEWANDTYQDHVENSSGYCAWTRGEYNGSIPGEKPADEQAEDARRMAIEQAIDDAAVAQWEGLWEAAKASAIDIQNRIVSDVRAGEQLRRHMGLTTVWEGSATVVKNVKSGKCGRMVSTRFHATKEAAEAELDALIAEVCK